MLLYLQPYKSVVPKVIYAQLYLKSMFPKKKAAMLVEGSMEKKKDQKIV
jgi:hypothetical protein